MGKGTHYGIKRITNFIKKCSENYTKDCYILKLDIQGFFLTINKDILYDRLDEFVSSADQHRDLSLILSLCKKIIYNDPTDSCIVKGKKADWEDLPKSKSLFHNRRKCGLPIGNLTSQIFANFYLNAFDHFILDVLHIKYYGRYMDA